MYCHRSSKTFVSCRNLYKKRNPRAVFVQNSKKKRKIVTVSIIIIIFTRTQKLVFLVYICTKRETQALRAFQNGKKPFPLLLLSLLSFSPGSCRYHNVWKRRENNKYSLVSVSSGCCWELLVGGEHFWFRNRHLNQYHHLHSWWSTRE
jgi:hypothetical protein